MGKQIHRLVNICDTSNKYEFALIYYNNESEKKLKYARNLRNYNEMRFAIPEKVYKIVINALIQSSLHPDKFKTFCDEKKARGYAARTERKRLKNFSKGFF